MYGFYFMSTGDISKMARSNQKYYLFECPKMTNSR
jgi:hypothetical protein